MDKKRVATCYWCNVGGGTPTIYLKMTIKPIITCGRLALVRSNEYDSHPVFFENLAEPKKVACTVATFLTYNLKRNRKRLPKGTPIHGGHPFE